ncbi:MAG: zinc-dependent alcohol dehydrogenase [Burkholderiales bacterium]
MTEALAIHHVAPEKVSIAATRLPPLASGHVLIRTRYSALSAGTESLIYRGHFPSGLAQDGTIASLQGAFDYPFRYGYALVGEVMEVGAGVDPALQGRHVFAFHPHQNLAVVPLCDVFPIPGHVEPRAALFLANMESAINFVMDANPVVGERAMVFGLGVVGLLTSALLSEFPLSVLIVADPVSGRRERALEWGAHRAVDPGDSALWTALQNDLNQGEPPGLDLAIELSGNMRALNQAIELCGFSGRIVVGSWYGRSTEMLELGTHFHRRRIELMSSQVSTLHPRLSGRWTKARRIVVAWEAISRLQPQRLITHSLPFRDCQRAFELASRGEDGVLQVIFEYG